VRRHCPDPYAKSYASVSADELESYDNGIPTQCLYILNNIAHWRGETANRVRANLKRIAIAKVRR
jgi:hypothetical protein